MEAVQERIQQDGSKAQSCAIPVEREKDNRKGRICPYLLLGASLLVSLYMLAYTPIHDWFHSMRMREIIADYDQKVAALSEEERSGIRKDALIYNSRLQLGTHFQLTQEELDEYSAQLNFTDDGMIGYIQIPKIKPELFMAVNSVRNLPS